MSTRWDLLLFDLGGVLVDFCGLDRFRSLLPGQPDLDQARRHWIASPAVDAFESGRLTGPEFARALVEEAGLELSPEALLAELPGWVRGPYPGALELLVGLRAAGHRLGCLSNANPTNSPRHRRDFEPYLDHLFFSDELGVAKPHREAFERPLASLGLAPERVAFFDDTEANVEAASAVGLDAHRTVGLAGLESRLEGLGIRPATAVLT